MARELKIVTGVILDAMRRLYPHAECVILGAPGAGKTTRVPLALREVAEDLCVRYVLEGEKRNYSFTLGDLAINIEQ